MPVKGKCIVRIGQNDFFLASIKSARVKSAQSGNSKDKGDTKIVQSPGVQCTPCANLNQAPPSLVFPAILCRCRRFGFYAGQNDRNGMCPKLV